MSDKGPKKRPVNDPDSADHEYASPESGDRAQPTNTGAKEVRHKGAVAPEVEPPADHEYAAPESGARAHPTK